MNEEYPPETPYDMNYGRISPYIPQHRPRKMKNATFCVKFWLSDWKPYYAHADTWLSYEVGNQYYQIFNPQRFAFSTDVLIAYLRTLHAALGDGTPENFQVIQGK